MSRQQQLLNSLNNWRMKASDYSRTDRIGNVLVRSFDLIGGIAMDGVESVSHLTEFLEHDREFAKAKDNKDVGPLALVPREFVYDLIESLGSMVEVLAEKRAKELRLKEQCESVNSDTNRSHMNVPPVHSVPREDPEAVIVPSNSFADAIDQSSLSSLVKHENVIGSVQNGVLRMYHEMGEPNRILENYELRHSVKEEFSEETNVMDNLFTVTKEEEEEALFDVGVMDAVEDNEGAQEPVFDEDEESMDNLNDTRQEDEKQEESTVPSEQRVMHRRVPASQSTSAAAVKRSSRASTAAAATPRNGFSRKKKSNSSLSKSARKANRHAKHICDICSYVAVAPSNLLIHMRSHTESCEKVRQNLPNFLVRKL